MMQQSQQRKNKVRAMQIEKLATNKYNHLLIVLVVFLFMAPSIEHGDSVPGQIIISLTLIFTIVLCLRAVIVSKKTFWLCTSIAILSFFCTIMERFIESKQTRELIDTINLFVIAIFVGLSILLLMKSMFHIKRVDSDMIVGGVCIYLLIGVLWALFYMLLENTERGVVELESGGSLFYFSFTTLTTLGYGDIVPQGRFSMMLATLEAASGQIYLAIFVARLVGLHIVHELKQESSA